MLKSRLLLGILFAVCILAACEKPEAYNEEAQYEIDEALIKKWADSTKTALIRDDSRLYYQIIDEGTGTGTLELTDTLLVLYEGRLLTDSVFSRTTDTLTYRFVLGKAIPGWQKGLPHIKEGGKIRLLVPSPLAYRQHPIDNVPANSVLNFTIDLKKVLKLVAKQK